MKAELRKALIARRRALTAEERASATRSALRRIERLPQFKPGARVALYQAFGSELDPSGLIEAARRRGVLLYVPKVIHLERRQMVFVPLGKDSHRRHAIGARWLDMIVLPIVGIGATGHRLGMGAGFFDRALAFRRTRGIWRGPLLVALGFDCQRAPTFEADHWDARLDMLVTELRSERFDMTSAR